jgi:hypothetical protein
VVACIPAYVDDDGGARTVGAAHLDQVGWVWLLLLLLLLLLPSLRVLLRVLLSTHTRPHRPPNTHQTQVNRGAMGASGHLDADAIDLEQLEAAKRLEEAALREMEAPEGAQE